MDDIVERLRARKIDNPQASEYGQPLRIIDSLCSEAADTIESLRAENARLTEERDALASVLDGAIKDDRIDEIDKIAKYKYFGHYEMSEAQLDATLDAIYALQTIKRMRAALAKVKGGTDAR